MTPSKSGETVRFGIVGTGYVGRWHATTLKETRARYVTLAAVADTFADSAKRAGEQFGVPWFDDPAKMLGSGVVDAIIVGTPHFWHPPVAIQAARAGVHVLCEKPLAATIGPARAMVDECNKRGVALGIMFQFRTRAVMRKIKGMVDSGRIGRILRISMLCSDWYRTQAYYDSGGWRGTWDGEGGGILQNQAPHHLDVFQWIGGMPNRITAVMSTHTHKIEVENTAHVLCEYGDGQTGYFFATTAELPGGESFRIVGDKGTLVYEGGKLTFGRLSTPISRHAHECKEARADFIPKPKCTWREVKLSGPAGGEHSDVILPFARHILHGTPMVCTGEEALNEVELSNAAYVSAFKGRPVTIPIDADEMEGVLAGLERERSTGRGTGQRAKALKMLRGLLTK